uniref:Cilia and flagella associated protein 90 n=2 Tax=Cyprinus carpio TaxID=7962 RepID=A0A9J8ADB2_CYPCA
MRDIKEVKKKQPLTKFPSNRRRSCVVIVLELSSDKSATAVMNILSETKSKPLSSLSVFSFIPPRRTEPKEMRYFNCSPKAPERSLYDCLHQSTEGYDDKLHRDDRKHDKSRGLDIFSEESSRPAPVLSSSVYGRFSPLRYDSGRSFARVAHIRSDFYSKNGITWTVEESYGSVTPV